MLNSLVGFILLIGSMLGINQAPALGGGSGTISQLSPWVVTGKTVKVASSTATLRVPFLASCDTIDTDADGVMTCGSDTGGAGSQTPWLANINAALYALQNVGSLSATSSVITQATSTNLAVTGLASCDTIDTDANGTMRCGTDSSGTASFPFTTESTWVATSTLLNLKGGLMAMASSTLQSLNLGSVTIPSLTSGSLAVGSTGSVYKAATTTYSTGLTYTNGLVTCDVASGSVAGCLSTANWTTFNNKDGFGWPFTQGSAWQSTSTVMNFTGGIMAASSTFTGATTTFQSNIVLTNIDSNIVLHSLIAHATDGLIFKNILGQSVASFGAGSSQAALFFDGMTTTGILNANGGITFTQATGTNVYASASSTFQDLNAGTLDVTGHTNMTSASTTGILTIHEICNEAGECWDSPTPAGSTVVFYPNNNTSNVGTYEDMLSIPSTGVTIDETCTADADITAGYCDIDTYISTTTDITITNYPAGTTVINSYTYSSASAGNTYLVFDGYRRTSGGVETWMGQATTSDINATTITDYSASFTGLSDYAFSTDGTDRLVWKIRAWTDSSAGRVVHFTYQSTSHYSRMATPIQIADRGYTKGFLNESIAGLWNFSGGFVSGASTTVQYLNSASSSIGTLAVPSLTSALLLTNANGVFAEYAGASACTAGQAVTAISALGATTCTAFSTFAYPFTSTSIGQSTSTLMQFTAGLIANASSTVQDFNSASSTIGKLLITGNATGTNAYFSTSILAALGNFTSAILGNATSTNFFASQAMFTTASSTNNTITNLNLPNNKSATIAVNSSGAVYSASTSTPSTFTFATSSLNVNSTTTISMGGFYGGATIAQFGCTGVGGTFTSVIGDGTASSTYVVSSNSLTTTYTALSSNNSFTSGEKIFWAIGPASAAGLQSPSCSWLRN